MTQGWTGQSLICRLHTATHELFDRSELRRGFLGGRGYGVALLAEFGDPRRSPLDPSQPFVLAAGPLTGTAAPSSGRLSAVAPSPLTSTIFDSNAGSRFGVRLRQAGLDALVLIGKAAEWSVLVVDGRTGGRAGGEDRPRSAGDSRADEAGDGRQPAPAARLVRLADLCPDLDPSAVDLLTSETSARLRAALGPAFSLVFPSVAGRRGALLGSLQTSDRRKLDRGGLGAALSAKRIFAVAVAGDRDLSPAEAETFSFVVYEARKQLAANPVTSRALPLFGTAVLMRLVHAAGALPALNYRSCSREGVDALCGEAVRESLAPGREGCFGCSIRCHRIAGRGAATRSGPEYETLWALGADCGIADLDAVGEASWLCNEYGLDAVSTGATIACAMEMTERGFLDSGPRFGDAVALLSLIEEMGGGRGLGAELADGAARFAARSGRPDLAMQVKGLELPAYDPRGMKGQGLGYATSNRGGCHSRANMVASEILGIPKLIDRYATRGKSGILINLQNLHAVFDSAGLCKLAGFALSEEIVARLLQAATGSSFPVREVLRTGERIWNLERLWNLAAGFTRADDMLPPRFLSEPVAAGPSAGQVVDLEPMLDEYYRARGWDEEGVPRPDKIKTLGLGEVAARLGESQLDATEGRASVRAV